MTNTTKPTIFSGVQPTGNLHLGNYLGAISQWVNMQDQYKSIFCVVDYHAITVKQDPEDLRKRIIEIVKHYLASGINPKKSVIFQQSAITAHTELAWILNTVARISDLKKMTQFKDKAGKDQENVSVGLFDYPVLMAADILLYNTDAVPVGEDQKQHVELCRDLAKRFNHQFGETFKIPEVIMRKEGARIMGLDDPTKKMSKSASSPANYIALNDTPEVAAKKIMRATTDSGSEIKYDKENKPAIANLLTIYSLLDNITIKELEKQYTGKGYGDFKKDLAEVVKKFLVKYQEKYNSYSDEEIKTILKQGAKRIKPIAEEVLNKVKTKIGININ
ncbi:MAG: Tryptophan-tRNA ligase [Parcubacteria group bacterium GW2011_GWE2_38_18]|nr:MAG: Tryptophan-tRNA ligase [Parcubacteria group bacterium GW2011_GWE2_38_18]